MTISVANTANTNSFYYWLQRTNELADAMSTRTITVESNTTTGNAHVNGTFSAVSLATTTLTGGNTGAAATLNIGSNVNITGVTNTAANVNVTGILYVNGNITSTGTVAVGSNVTLNTSVLTIGNSTVNSTINSSSLVLEGETVNSSSIASWNAVAGITGTLSFTTTSAVAQIVDSFEKSSYRTAEYVLSVTDNNSNSYQASKLLVIHNDSTSTADLMEYGVLITNSSFVTFSANANTTHVRLIATPSSTNTTIKGNKVLIVI